MKKILLSTGIFLTPVMVFAQANPNVQNVQNFFDQVGALLTSLLPILVTLAVVLFFWGLAVFIFSAGNEDGRERGKQIMIWGVIALFIIVSIWGIVAFLGNLFGIEQGGSAPVPNVGAPGGTLTI